MRVNVGIIGMSILSACAAMALFIAIAYAGLAVQKFFSSQPVEAKVESQK